MIDKNIKIINPGVDGPVFQESPFVEEDTILGQSVRETACGNGFRMGFLSNSDPEKVFKEGTEDWYNLPDLGYWDQLSHYNGVGTLGTNFALIVQKSLTSES